MQDVDEGWSYSSWDSCYSDTQFCSCFLHFPLIIYLFNSTVYPTVYTTIENKWCERSKPSTESWRFGAFELLTLEFNFNYDFVIFFVILCCSNFTCICMCCSGETVRRERRWGRWKWGPRVAGKLTIVYTSF